MTQRIMQSLFGFFVGVLMCGGTSVWAQGAVPTAPQEGSWNVGVRSGYSIGQRSIDTVPVNLHIGYIVFKGKPWIFPEGAFEIATEPFFSPVTAESSLPSRDASIEAGLMLPVLTYHFDLGYRLSPYIEGGLGILYHDFTGYHLGGGLNFTEMAGAGLTYFLEENLSINIGYRFRHSSNASLYDENKGLNAHSFLGGFSYFLPQN